MSLLSKLCLCFSPLAIVLRVSHCPVCLSLRHLRLKLEHHFRILPFPHPTSMDPSWASPLPSHTSPPKQQHLGETRDGHPLPRSGPNRSYLPQHLVSGQKQFYWKPFTDGKTGLCRVSLGHLLLFSCYVASDLPSHGLQHTSLPCLSPSPRGCGNSLSIELVMQSNHLILCHPLLLLHRGLFQ